ncbi:MAG: molybdopterin-dependent oxidoreductase, partial [Pseudomonadota bacterium]|nr:molybdopterin-dependent oxidoreductase [Pseudomonadota bacterium]
METRQHAKAWVGQRVLRKEDPPLVTGRGSYVADIKIPGTLSVAIVRSPVARGRIVELDVSIARRCPGVVEVVTADDLRGRVAAFHLLQERIPPGLANSTQASVEVQPCNLAVLADGRVAYVGEPVAAVVAVNRYLAEDAAEQVVLQIEEEPPIAEPAEALRPAAPLVDDGTPGNIAARLHAECGDVQTAFREAPHQLRLELRIGRVAAAPMECRGVLALQPQPNGEITVWSSTQVPYIVRSAIARQLDLPEDQIRVIAPHVGGGFGAKVHVYPEDILVPHLAMRLGRPVRWVEDRSENLMATAHGRDQSHEVEVAFDDR